MFRMMRRFLPLGSTPMRLLASLCFDVRMKDPFIRVKFTKEQSFARQLAKEYFEKYPKDRYQTEVESWREIQSRNIEFIMKRLREPLK
jgi:hypothetical protein